MDDLIFLKMHLSKATILLYQNLHECKNFVNLKETQLLYIVIKQKKPFVVPKACKR